MRGVNWWLTEKEYVGIFGSFIMREAIQVSEILFSPTPAAEKQMLDALSQPSLCEHSHTGRKIHKSSQQTNLQHIPHFKMYVTFFKKIKIDFY